MDKNSLAPSAARKLIVQKRNDNGLVEVEVQKKRGFAIGKGVRMPNWLRKNFLFHYLPYVLCIIGSGWLGQSVRPTCENKSTIQEITIQNWYFLMKFIKSCWKIVVFGLGYWIFSKLKGIYATTIIETEIISGRVERIGCKFKRNVPRIPRACVSAY